MIKLLNRYSSLKLMTAAFILISGMSLQSCHDAKARQDNSENDIAGLRPDDALTKLTRSLAEGDAPGFAALCVYPIRRPYPLKNINDSVSMVDYFPILVDDSLRSVFRTSSLEDWQSYGWRGWSLTDSRPLWYDEGVQIIDYVSPAENGLKSILAREEIMSLLPKFREGWRPVSSMVQTDGDRIFRIDTNGETFRLMQFDDAASAGGEPSLILFGSLRHEGTADYPIFEFSDSKGRKAEYLPDSEPPVYIYVTGSGIEDQSIPVVPAYWRDIIR